MGYSFCCYIVICEYKIQNNKKINDQYWQTNTNTARFIGNRPVSKQCSSYLAEMIRLTWNPKLLDVLHLCCTHGIIFLCCVYENIVFTDNILLHHGNHMVWVQKNIVILQRSRYCSCFVMRGQGLVKRAISDSCKGLVLASHRVITIISVLASSSVHSLHAFQMSTFLYIYLYIYMRIEISVH